MWPLLATGGLGGSAGASPGPRGATPGHTVAATGHTTKAPAPPGSLPQDGAEQGATRFEWTLIYWIAEDNDLGSGVQAAHRHVLAAAPRDPRIAVVALSDGPEANDMAWHGLTATAPPRRARPTRVAPSDPAAENSAEPAALAAGLTWASQHFPARRYLLTFVGHGGVVGTFGVDAQPGGDDAQPAWMLVKQAAAVVASWRRARERLGERLELVHLQVCGQASLEALELWQGAAPWLLASQGDLAASSAVYAPLHKRIGREPEVSAEGLAEWIVAAEPCAHYVTYVLVDLAAAAELADNLGRLLAAWAPQLQRPLEPPAPGPITERMRVAIHRDRAVDRPLLVSSSGWVRLDGKAAHGVQLDVLDAAGATLAEREAVTPSFEFALWLHAGEHRLRLTARERGPAVQAVAIDRRDGAPLLPCYFAPGQDLEACVDLCEWLAALARANRLPAAPLVQWQRWFETTLTRRVWRSASQFELARQWHGVSRLDPATRQSWSAATARLHLYRSVSAWSELAARLLPASLEAE